MPGETEFFDLVRPGGSATAERLRAAGAENLAVPGPDPGGDRDDAAPVCRIIRTGNGPAGFVICRETGDAAVPDTLLVEQLALLPGIRHREFGTAVLRRIIELAGDAGYRRIILHAAPGSSAAGAVCRSCEFKCRRTAGPGGAEIRFMQHTL